jgi:hypothetical protein
MKRLIEKINKYLVNENLLAGIGGIGKMPGDWGKRLGTFGTVLYKALKDNNIEVINLKPIGKFENELTVSYKGKKKKIKLGGDSSADKVIKKIVGKSGSNTSDISSILRKTRGKFLRDKGLVAPKGTKSAEMDNWYNPTLKKK